MPNRILRDGILRSPQVARLGWAEEVFYRRLHSVVDDFGTYYADPGLLRADCYPRQISKVSDSDIEKWLRACVDAALVRVYPAPDGERYLQVLKFRQQVRATKSRFPQPPAICAADAQHPPSDGEAPAHLDVFVSESVFVSEREPRATRLASSWVLPDGWRTWARAERPDLDPGFTASNFLDYWQAKPGKDGRKLDWEATWRNWVRAERAPRNSPTLAAVTVPAAASTVTKPYIPEPLRTPEQLAASEVARKRVMAEIRGIA